MSLYQLPLPPLELLPITIPEHIHPLLVHFAIALPIIILIVELFNIVAKRRSIAVLSLFFMLLLGVSIFGAIATGITDAKLAHAASEAKEIILEHKAIGTFMLYGVGFLIVLKLLSMFVSKNLFKLGYVLFMFIFIATTFYEGKLGGSLVYEHAINVKSSANTATQEPAQKPVKVEEKKDETVHNNHKEEPTEAPVEVKEEHKKEAAQDIEEIHSEKVTEDKNSTQEMPAHNTTEENKTQVLNNNSNNDPKMNTEEKIEEHNTTNE